MYVDRWLFVICQWVSTIGRDSKESRTSESISRTRGPASPTPLLYVLFSFKFIIRLTERVEQNLNILSSMTFKSISTHTTYNQEAQTDEMDGSYVGSQRLHFGRKKGASKQVTDICSSYYAVHFGGGDGPAHSGWNHVYIKPQFSLN